MNQEVCTRGGEQGAIHFSPFFFFFLFSDHGTGHIGLDCRLHSQPGSVSEETAEIEGRGLSSLLPPSIVSENPRNGEDPRADDMID